MPSTTEAARAGLSVVVLTYRNAPFLDAQLRSLRGQLRPCDEIVVTEDGPYPGTREVIAAHGDHLAIRHVSHPDDGRRLCLARNRGILEARNSLILTLDHDVIFQPGSIERLRNTIRPGWAIGLRRVMIDARETELTVERSASGRSTSWTRLRLLSLCRRWEGRRFLFPMRRRDCTVPSQTWRGCAGFGLMVFRDDLDRVNGFDARYDGESYTEDLDLFARLDHAGVKFAHPDYRCSVGHLEHGRPDQDLTSRNYAFLEDVLDRRTVRASVGLAELEEAMPTGSNAAR